MTGIDFKNKNIIVVGGTQGIGAGISIKLSSLGANVIIGGRNEKLANEILQKMRKENKDNDNIYMFKKVDQSIVSDIKNFINEVSNIYDKLDYLIISSGIIPKLPRKETEDGVEYQFATNALGRFILTYLFIPMLKKSDNSKVLLIAAGGKGTEIDLEDIEFKNKPYKFMDVARRDSTYLDTITNEFSKKYSNKFNILFYHIYPGMVNTNVMYNSDQTKILSKISDFLFYILGNTPKEYAEKFVKILELNIRKEEKGIFINNKGEQIKSSDWIYNIRNGETIWDYSLKISGLENENIN